MVTVVINPINDNPVANADADTTPYETAVTTVVVTNDTDLDGDSPLTVSVCTNPLNGSVIVAGNDSCEFTPDTGFSGTGTYEYTLNDNNGGIDT